MNIIKICSSCSIDYDICKFYKSSSSSDGYRSECKNCSKLRQKENNNKRKKYAEKYRLNNREKINERQKKYQSENKEKIKKRKQDKKETQPLSPTKPIVLAWRKKNKDIFNKNRRERYQNDIILRLSQNVRNRLNSYIKKNNFSKNNKTFEIVGCSPEELKTHIESLFLSGMTWENKGKWHIDHIIPLSLSKNENEIISLSHYNNLQPLWAKDNLSKRNKIKT